MSRRELTVELTPPLLNADEDLSELSGLTVTVEARATVGDFVWGVMPSEGMFAPFADVNGFASAGGAAAALSLSSDATVLFNADGLALSLTLTLTRAGEERTGTVTFVSSAREFDGAGLSTLIVTTALAAGTEVFGSSAAGLTIWHSADENESYTLEGESAGLFVVGADGGVSASGEIRPTELVRYELTLALSGSEAVSRRELTVELTPPLLNADEDLSELSGLTVTVEARATVGDFVWGVMPSEGMFAPFADVNGFASAGGAAAALSLSSDATVLFNADGLALSLTLTLTRAGEERTGTVTFVSSAREFDGAGLSTLIVTTALAAGTEVFGSSAAGLTIWHSADENESYTLEGESAGLFVVGADGGVSASGEIRPTELVRYELTLALSGSEAVSRRELTVELTPPLLNADEDLSELSGLTVTVEARATVGDFVWGVMPSEGMFAPFADVNGFASAGGAAAALSLSSDATVLFNADGLALSLTLTLTRAGEERTGTVTFVSSAREFDGAGLSTLIVTTALAAGTEVFGSSAAGLTIWHSADENESYTLEGESAGLFVVGADGGVSASGEIRPTELVRYELTLALSGSEAVSRRELTVELTPPLLNADEDLSELSGLTVTVEARATVGDFVWGVMPSEGMFAPFADVNGFASAGGAAAALSLSSDATVLFNADGLALSLTLTLTRAGEERTGTVTFVSSAREFDGAGLSTLIVTTALAAGTEVFGSSAAGLTIWHSADENESYTLEGESAGLFVVGADGGVSASGEIRPTELVRYELTLALSGSEAVSRRELTVELTPPLLNADEDLSELSGLTVTVEARATVGDFVWGVMPSEGMFAPFADVNGFASAGGAAAALSLSSDATVLFNADGLALSLTLTLTRAGEERTGTVTFVSSAREFDGAGLSTLIVTTALAAGTEVFGSSAAGLTIWHSADENESYTLEGESAGLFVVGADGGVSASGEIRPTELVRYELTLALSGSEAVSRRELTVELTPPLLNADEDLSELSGLTVTVEARATVGDFVWGVMPSEGMFAPFADVNGFASAGGAAAALSLSSDATVLFNADGLALSLTLTLTRAGEERTGTVTFVSSAREFDGAGLSTLIVTTALAAGTEVFGSSAAGLTIWHSADENESYTLEGESAGLFVVGADGGVSASGEIRPTELVRYELTLALSGSEAVSRRELTVELTPPLLNADEDLSELSGLTVTVEARATVGDFVWGVMPSEGMFAPFADVNGFASAGGAAAALSLSSDATVLFNADGLALSLTLTLTRAGEERTGTVTFVSSAREFDGAGLSTLIVTTALAAGTEVFAIDGCVD